ncbi:hypothetical protein SUDANB176_06309 [Streptomyces sp. enrichment culture]|uniref:hypothetical protein n=1 Tax=Streptomyces sp. enrichment culture TaxID=1795815 RepID=UPI003F55740A
MPPRFRTARFHVGSGPGSLFARVRHVLSEPVRLKARGTHVRRRRDSVLRIAHGEQGAGADRDPRRTGSPGAGRGERGAERRRGEAGGVQRGGVTEEPAAAGPVGEGVGEGKGRTDAGADEAV